MLTGATVLLSGIVHGYSGFGGALLMVPLLGLFLSPVEAVAVTNVAAVFGQLSVARPAVRNAVWAECLPFIVAIAVAMPLGVMVLVKSEAELLRRIVGASTLTAATILGLGWTYKGARTVLTSGFFGGLCGFLAGATGQGGPPAVVYFMAAPVEARQQRGSLIAAITGMVFVTLVFLAVGGALSRHSLLLGCLVGLPYIVAVRTGNRLFEILPKQNYRRATLLLLFAAGLAALFR